MTEAMLRRELIRTLETRDAHMSFEEAVADFPDEAINRRAPNVDYSPYDLVEHLRLVQFDLLDYLTNPDYQEKPWPAGSWPPPGTTATREDFDRAVDGFVADRRELRRLIEDPARDVFGVVPGSPGHTLLREIRIAGDHCAYHVGEFAVLRQVMGTWPPGRAD